MVQGAVTDFFRQTVMDFYYGSTTLSALERYSQDLAAQDPAEAYRLAKVRASAIESCASIVLAEGEERIEGWCLFSPIEPNKIQSPKLEEKVVLLVSACASCRFGNSSAARTDPPWLHASPLCPSTPTLRLMFGVLRPQTSKAIYVCGYDFTAEKLSEYSRIGLGDVVGLKKGLYIISPSEGYHPEDNWGFVLSYLNEERR